MIFLLLAFDWVRSCSVGVGPSTDTLDKTGKFSISLPSSHLTGRIMMVVPVAEGLAGWSYGICQVRSENACRY